MVTTKIQIKPHLALYFTKKYWSEDFQCVKIPRTTFVRVKILCALRKRPADCPVDHGNFEFAVPTSEDFPEKKDTDYWNYIPPAKVKGGPKRPGIERMLEDEFYSDLNDYWYRYKYYGLDFKDAVEDFLEIYDLTVAPETVQKFFTRWQDRRRHLKNTRKYEKQRAILQKLQKK